MVSTVENKASFSFTCATVDNISKEIKRLSLYPFYTKVLVPVSLKVSSLMILKREWFIQLIKKNAKLKSLTTDQLAFCQISLKYQCGFRKCYNAQHCLLVMIEKMKEPRDKNKVCAAVLTDLSKAFDCLKHDLLIEKLHAFHASCFSCMHILIIEFKSQKLVLITVKFLTFSRVNIRFALI